MRPKCGQRGRLSIAAWSPTNCQAAVDSRSGACQWLLGTYAFCMIGTLAVVRASEIVRGVGFACATPALYAHSVTTPRLPDHLMILCDDRKPFAGLPVFFRQLDGLGLIPDPERPPGGAPAVCAPHWVGGALTNPLPRPGGAFYSSSVAAGTPIVSLHGSPFAGQDRLY
jgi:hypothetical protein